MDAKRCDKCRTFFDASDEYTILSYKKIGGLFYANIDLCEKCTDEFQKFLNFERKES